MKVLFYLGHPAHFHLFRYVIEHLGDRAEVVIKSKDVLAELLDNSGIGYYNIEESVPFRSSNKAGLAFRILKRVSGLRKVIRKTGPSVLAGSPAELALAGKLTGKPAYMFFEDDVEKVKPYGSVCGPFAAKMICPDVCSAGKWDSKKIGYPSYHELAYLHPNRFTPDRDKAYKYLNNGNKNIIIRFVELGAFHDDGKTGITDEFANQLVKALKTYGDIHITSERSLPGELEQYRLKLPAQEMHHVLGFADMFIGDSQTMNAEAAVLGTPALRYNDFVGELSYLEDLEHNYSLTFGFKPGEQKKLIEKAHELLSLPDLKEEWNRKRQKLLNDKIDLTDWMIRFFENNCNE